MFLVLKRFSGVEEGFIYPFPLGKLKTQWVYLGPEQWPPCGLAAGHNREMAHKGLCWVTDTSGRMHPLGASTLHRRVPSQWLWRKEDAGVLLEGVMSARQWCSLPLSFAPSRAAPLCSPQPHWLCPSPAPSACPGVLACSQLQAQPGASPSCP